MGHMSGSSHLSAQWLDYSQLKLPTEVHSLVKCPRSPQRQQALGCPGYQNRTNSLAIHTVDGIALSVRIRTVQTPLKIESAARSRRKENTVQYAVKRQMIIESGISLGVLWILPKTIQLLQSTRSIHFPAIVTSHALTAMFSASPKRRWIDRMSS